jgi:hypothetical protein
MILAKTRKLLAGVAAAAVIIALGSAYAQQGPRGSYFTRQEVDATALPETHVMEASSLRPAETPQTFVWDLNVFFSGCEHIPMIGVGLAAVSNRPNIKLATRDFTHHAIRLGIFLQPHSQNEVGGG